VRSGNRPHLALHHHLWHGGQSIGRSNSGVVILIPCHSDLYRYRLPCSIFDLVRPSSFLSTTMSYAVSAPLSPPTHVQSHGSNSIVVRHPLFSVSSLQPADHTQISDMHLQNTSTHRQSYRRFRTILVAHRPPTAAGCSCSRRRSIYC